MRTFGSKPASIPYSRWTAYGAAATASAFVCASSAEAEIHYSGVVNHNFANGSFAGPLDPGVSLTLAAGTGTQIGNNTSEFGFIHIRDAAQNKLIGTFVGTLASYAGVYALELPAGQSLPAQRFAISCRWSSSCGCQVCYHGALYRGRGEIP